MSRIATRNVRQRGRKMREYLVETLAISGKFVPLNGEYRPMSFLEASVETFACRLAGIRSRIVTVGGIVVVHG